MYLTNKTPSFTLKIERPNFVVERLEVSVSSTKNEKVVIMDQMNPRMRIGQFFDAHRITVYLPARLDLLVYNREQIRKGITVVVQLKSFFQNATIFHFSDDFRKFVPFFGVPIVVFLFPLYSIASDRLSFSEMK